MNQFHIRISKTLSYVLRHGAKKENIEMRSDGYVALVDLLNHKLFKKVTMEDI